MFRVLIEVATNGAFNLKLSICLMFIFLKFLLVNVYWLMFIGYCFFPWWGMICLRFGAGFTPVGYGLPRMSGRFTPPGDDLPAITRKPCLSPCVLPRVLAEYIPYRAIGTLSRDNLQQAVRVNHNGIHGSLLLVGRTEVGTAQFLKGTITRTICLNR